MPGPSTIHSTFVIERSYPKPLDYVFSGFADAGALIRTIVKRVDVLIECPAQE